MSRRDGEATEGAVGADAPPLRDGEGGLDRGGSECDVGQGGRQLPVHTVDEGRGVEMGSARVRIYISYITRHELAFHALDR